MRLRFFRDSTGVTLGVCFVVLLAASGCHAPAEEFEIPDWTPIVAVPLVDTHFDLADILETLSGSVDTMPVEVMAGGQLAFVYSEDFTGTLASEWLLVPSVFKSAELVLDEPLASAINLTDPGDVLVLSDTLTSEMIVDSPPGALVDDVELAQGLLTFSVQSTLGEQVEGQLTIPNLLDPMGMPWSVAWTDAMLDGGSFEVNEDLTGWRIIPENLNVQDTNVVRAFFDVFVINDAGHTSEAGEYLAAQFSMEDLVYERVVGDFGSSQIFLEEGTSSLALFDDRFTVSGVALAEANLSLEVTNGFGLAAILDSVELLAMVDGVVVSELVHTVPPLFVPPASGDYLSPSTTTWLMDATNSNVTSFFSVEPREVSIAAWVRSNPEEVTPDNPNFLDADGYVNAKLRAEIPLGFRVEQLDFLDTVDVEMDFGDEATELDSASLRMIVHNGFPFGVEVSAVFLDEFGDPVDSLSLSPLPIFSMPDLDAAGAPVEPAVFTHDFPFDWERANRLKLVRSAVLRAWSSTPDAALGEMVYLTEDQGLQLELGAKCYLRIAQ
jgi:hypothetical protein